MEIRCERCGEIVREGTNFCPSCGKFLGKNIELFSGASGTEFNLTGAIFQDFRVPQKPQKLLLSVEKIKQQIGYGAKRVKVNWKKTKNTSILALLLNLLFFVSFGIIWSSNKVPRSMGQKIWIISFATAVVLLCIYSVSSLNSGNLISGLFKMTGKINYNKALAKFVKALRWGEDDLNTWRSIGYLYLSAGEHEQCIEACNMGLSITPEDEVLLWILYSSYSKVNEPEKAKEFRKRVKGVNEGDWAAIEVNYTEPYFRLIKLKMS